MKAKKTPKSSGLSGFSFTSAQRRIILIVLILAIGVGSYLFLSGKYSDRYTGPTEKFTIVTPFSGVEVNTLLYVAQDKGYFKAQGLDVTIKDVPSSVVGQQEILEGRADLSAAGDYTIATASYNKQTSKIITSIDKNKFFDVVARKDRGINGPSDLKGKKIGTIVKTSIDFFLSQFLEDNGLTIGDVTVVPAASADQLVADIVSGRVDAVSVGAPQTYQINKSLGQGVNVLSEKQSRTHSFYWMLTASPDNILKRPQAIERSLQALVRAEAFVKSNKKETQDILKKRYPDKDQAYFDYVWGKHDFAVALEQPLIYSLENETRWNINNGVSIRAKIPDFITFIDPYFLDIVKPKANGIY